MFVGSSNKLKLLLNSFQYFMRESVLMNWSNISKSILVLLLAGIDQILWLLWCLYAFSSPELHQWLNLTYIKIHIFKLIITLSGFFIFALLIYRFRRHLLIKKYCAYFAVAYFGIVFIHGGYSIGVLSPSTIGGYISLVSVGLVLFERKVVYVTFIPITILLLGLIIATAHDVLSYAPLFSERLNNSVLSDNVFWIYSMLYLYVPIFFASIVLFEVLLIQWKNREKFFNEMSQKDPLTGLFNRRMINQTLKNIQKTPQAHSIVLLDLDHFKNINDVHGHDVGDQVLQHVANILKSSLRSHDIVGRFGGEEFILILKEPDQNNALKAIERCRQAVANQGLFLADQNKTLFVSASFGLTMLHKDEEHELAIRQADEALYYAKKMGRNQVRTYTELIQAKLENNKKIVN